MGTNQTSGGVTTITLCTYPEGQRFWAFNQMGGSRRLLSRAPGLRFWKLLGTGTGKGFSLRADFSRYGLLAVWASPRDADEFFARSALMASYRHRSSEMWTVRLQTIGAHGAWSGHNPFLPETAASYDEGPVAVLTRATVRFAALTAFWRAVPSTSATLDRAEGLLASVGTGELPFVRPATFSVWRSRQDLERYAYGTPEHQEVIRRRQDERWYTEELFARFKPVASEGTWHGRNPLEGLL